MISDFTINVHVQNMNFHLRQFFYCKEIYCDFIFSYFKNVYFMLVIVVVCEKLLHGNVFTYCVETCNRLSIYLIFQYED